MISAVSRASSSCASLGPHVVVVFVVVAFLFAAVVSAHDDSICGQRPMTMDEYADLDRVDRKWAVSLQQFQPVSIATYFHIIEAENGDGFVSDSDIEALMANFNSAFAGTGFSFALAGSFHYVNDTQYYAEDRSPVELAMKAELRIGGPETLNLYSKFFPPRRSGQLLGYAAFPISYERAPTEDGVVMLTSIFNRTYEEREEGDVLVHEVGHWMGLLHTFFDFRIIPGIRSLKCIWDNDRVRDTPLQVRPTYGCPRIARNSCKLRRGRDPINNYMNYGNDECMSEFTRGQIERMQSQWLEYRAPN